MEECTAMNDRLRVDATDLAALERPQPLPRSAYRATERPVALPERLLAVEKELQ
jgi:hypothetical protein